MKSGIRRIVTMIFGVASRHSLALAYNQAVWFVEPPPQERRSFQHSRLKSRTPKGMVKVVSHDRTIMENEIEIGT